MLGIVARKYAHKIPFIVKINHNELLTYPNKFEQILFGDVEQAWDMGAAAVGATIYFGSDDADREIVEIAEAFEHAHELGMATVLWCLPPQQRLQEGRQGLPHRRPTSPARRTTSAVTIQADIIKQKLATNNGGYTALNFGKTSPKLYDATLVTDHPIDWCRWQVANCYMGRASLINSGGDSNGGRTTSPRRCARRSSTSAPAAPA